MFKSLALVLLLASCASTQKEVDPGLLKLRREVDTLRQFTFSHAFVIALQGCEVAGKLCVLSTKNTTKCQQNTEECVILNYRQWESIKKQWGWE